jgi:hypothetical protein
MRIDFSPRLQMNPLAFAQAGLGLIQAGAGYLQQRKATKELEKMQSPTYTANKGILDYYNKSLAKYNVNPYSTSYYKQAEKMAGRNLASGLSSLQGRGQALAGVSSLVQGSNDAMLKAGATAEEFQRQDLSRLGQAAGMKAGEEQTAFNVNQMQPFERKYNLKAAKAGGGVDIMNAGISNIFGAGQNYLNQRMIGKEFSGDNSSQSTTAFMPYQKSVYNQLMENRSRRVG